MKLAKLSLNDFQGYALSQTKLRCLIGGASRTDYETKESSGTDFVNDCGETILDNGRKYTSLKADAVE